MGDELEKDPNLLSLQCQLNQTSITWKQELERHDSQVEILQEKLLEVKVSIRSSEDYAKKELELLWRRVRTMGTLLTYLKSKARIMAVPHLAHTSCGIKHQDGIGLIDKHGTPLSDWSKNIDLSSFENSNEEVLLLNSNRLGLLDANDGAYVSEVLKSVQLVTDVMEALVKRVIMAETEAAIEKEKVNLGHEEIRKKALQIEIMSSKVREMEKFALGTNGILNEMRQKVEDMVQETSRQRMRAAENEQELFHVKQDFESLKSYVSSLIGVREALLPSDQLQSHENLLEMYANVYLAGLSSSCTLFPVSCPILATSLLCHASFEPDALCLLFGVSSYDSSVLVGASLKRIVEFFDIPLCSFTLA